MDNLLKEIELTEQLLVENSRETIVTQMNNEENETANNNLYAKSFNLILLSIFLMNILQASDSSRCK
jgi:hypothetical protein